LIEKEYMEGKMCKNPPIKLGILFSKPETLHLLVLTDEEYPVLKFTQQI
jgi:hypothetical protein